MPTVDDFITNDITNPPAIPPGLQAVVDKVMSRSTMARGEREAAATVAGSALYGVAGQGVQRRGALEQTKLTEAGLTSRLGLTGQTELGKQKMVEAGATKRAEIAAAPGLVTAESDARRKPTPDTPQTPPEIEESWWARNREKFFDY
jgi:hypothetical protein